MALKRIGRELRDWEALLKDISSQAHELQAKISQDVGKDSKPLWTVQFLGPTGTPYAGGTFIVTVEFPLDYPFRPPQFGFATPIYHPNFRPGEPISLKLFQNWAPNRFVYNGWEEILQLMRYPNLDTPIRTEIAEQYIKDVYEFNRVARDQTLAQNQPITTVIQVSAVTIAPPSDGSCPIMSLPAELLVKHIFAALAKARPTTLVPLHTVCKHWLQHASEPELWEKCSVPLTAGLGAWKFLRRIRRDTCSISETETKISPCEAMALLGQDNLLSRVQSVHLLGCGILFNVDGPQKAIPSAVVKNFFGAGGLGLNLRHLEFQHCAILDHFSDIPWANMPSLRYLKLAHCQKTTDKRLQFAEKLFAGCPIMDYLSFDSSEVDREEAKACLRLGQNLSYVELNFLFVGDDFVDALCEIKKLRQLYLLHNSISDEGFERMAAALPQLQSLSLSINKVVTHLRLSAMTALTHLDANTCPALRTIDRPPKPTDPSLSARTWLSLTSVSDRSLLYAANPELAQMYSEQEKTLHAANRGYVSHEPAQWQIDWDEAKPRNTIEIMVSTLAGSSGVMRVPHNAKFSDISTFWKARHAQAKSVEVRFIHNGHNRSPYDPVGSVVNSGDKLYLLHRLFGG